MPALHHCWEKLWTAGCHLNSPSTNCPNTQTIAPNKVGITYPSPSKWNSWTGDQSGDWGKKVQKWKDDSPLSLPRHLLVLPHSNTVPNQRSPEAAMGQAATDRRKTGSCFETVHQTLKFWKFPMKIDTSHFSWNLADLHRSPPLGGLLDWRSTLWDEAWSIPLSRIANSSPHSWKTVELVTCDNTHDIQTAPIIPQVTVDVTSHEREFLFGREGRGRLEDEIFFHLLHPRPFSHLGHSWG